MTINLESSPFPCTDWLSNNIFKKSIRGLEAGRAHSCYKFEYIAYFIYKNFYKGKWRLNDNDNLFISH